MILKNLSPVFLLSFRFCGLAILSLSLSSGVSAQNQTIGNDVLNYNPPLELQKQLPYFLSGMDKEGSPVWVMEFGAWDLRRLVAKGREYPKMIEKYTDQMLTRFQESPKEFGADDFILIADLTGYDLRQFTSYSSVQIVFHMARYFVQLHQKAPTVKKVYIVNSNYLTETLYRLIKPILGDITNFIDLYGSDSSKWTPVLLRQINKDQIPVWLGGSKNHTPLKIYG